jgi:predicted nuclease of predicted toxin-antitoxin system
MPWKPLREPSDAEIREIVRENRGKAKFLVDENLGAEVTRVLREDGWNVTDVFELNIAGQPDENVFAVARKRDRILLTHDEDFLDDQRFPPKLNPGLVVLPGAEGNARALLSAIYRVLSIVGHLRELWRSTKIVITTDGMWTVMTFDQSTGRIIKSRYRFPRNRMEVWEDEP